MKKSNRLLSIILPNKKINIFIVFLVIISVTFGAIYANMINLNDQNLVINQIKNFINNINTNNLNSIILFKNSLIINLIYTISIWLLGLTIIGSFLAIIILFIKNFIFGFSLASFIITYKYKGIILSTIYLLFNELINIIIIITISIYCLTFTINLIKKYLNKVNLDKYNHKFIKNYSLILLISIILNILSSLISSFVFPSIIKLIVKLYV